VRCIVTHIQSDIMVHKTPTGERIKQLRSDARKLGVALIAAAELNGLDDRGQDAQCVPGDRKVIYDIT
jgi:hypothetical protein